MQIAGGHGHTIDQNLIGTDKGGTVRVENRQGGIWANSFNPGAPVGDEIHDITVGGVGELSGNVISGNGSDGVEFSGAGAGNKVLKNLVGTDYTGTVALTNNGQGGIETIDAEGLTIGDTHGNGNLVSGNAVYGLYLFGGNHTVQGNKIGTNLAGSAAIRTGTRGSNCKALTTRQSAARRTTPGTSSRATQARASYPTPPRTTPSRATSSGQARTGRRRSRTPAAASLWPAETPT